MAASRLEHLSGALAAFLPAMPIEQRVHVLQTACTAVVNEAELKDRSVTSALGAIASGISDQDLSDELAARSEEADTLYFDLLEEDDEMAQRYFEIARAYSALAAAVSANPSVEEVVYEACFGFSDLALAARNILLQLRPG